MAALSADDRAGLEECLAEAGLQRNDFASLLRAVRLRGRSGTPLWFVRPTLQPYCMALYGAHIFRFFLFEDIGSTTAPQFLLHYQDDADAFSISRHLDHGLNDIASTGCWAMGCRIERMVFDGQEYRPIQCEQTFPDDHGRETRTTWRGGCADTGGRAAETNSGG